MLMQCWQKDPQHRPSFKTIKEFFASISDAEALEASGGDPNALRGKVAPNEQEERENFRAKLGEMVAPHLDSYQHNEPDTGNLVKAKEMWSTAARTKSPSLSRSITAPPSPKLLASKFWI